MRTTFNHSFGNNIAFGAPSEGTGGSYDEEIHSDEVFLGDEEFLGVIQLGPGYFGPGHGNGYSEDGYGVAVGGSGSVVGDSGSDQIDSDLLVEILSAESILNSLVSSGATNIVGPISLETVADYAAKNSSSLEQQYAAQESFIQSIPLLSGLSATEVREMIEIIKMAGMNLGAGASWWDFAVVENIEVWPGIFEEIQSAKQISEAHLLARELVEQGHTIAEAQMISNGHLLDEYVVSDTVGNFSEIDVGNFLISSGIDVSEGLFMIDTQTNFPDFAIPALPGMEEYDQNSINYHTYNFDYQADIIQFTNLQGPNALDALEQALIANATPGDDDSLATINGTVNNAGFLFPGDDGDNFVYSTVVKNPNPNQSALVINYTLDGDDGWLGTQDSVFSQGGNIISDGWVGAYIQRNDATPGNPHDEVYSYSLIRAGEGDGFLQSVGGFVANDMAEAEWALNAQEIFQAADDFLGGL